MALTLTQLGRMSDAELVEALEEMLATGLTQAAAAVQAELDRRSPDDTNVNEGPVTSTEQLTTTNITNVIGPGFGGGGSFLLNGAVGAVAGRLIGGKKGALVGTVLGLVFRPIGPATVPVPAVTGVSGLAGDIVRDYASLSTAQLTALIAARANAVRTYTGDMTDAEMAKRLGLLEEALNFARDNPDANLQHTYTHSYYTLSETRRRIAAATSTPGGSDIIGGGGGDLIGGAPGGGIDWVMVGAAGLLGVSVVYLITRKKKAAKGTAPAPTGTAT